MSKPSTTPFDKATTAPAAASIAHAGRVASRRRSGTAAAPAAASNRTGLHDAEALAHELRVHQIELESQNEDLRNTQLDLAAARDRFLDLYDFAPVGYFTLDRGGRITELNLTGAALLGAPRKSLIGRHFSGFVTAADLRRWRRHLLIALQHDEGRRVELALKSRRGPPMYAQLDCLRVAQAVDGAVLRVTMTDASQRRLAEMDRRFANSVVEARESERRRVARELHEELGQRLSALKMDLASLPEVSGAQTPRLQAMLTALGQAVATVRRISTDLRPAMLDDLGLNAAIEGLAQESAQRLGLTVTLRLGDCDPPLGERTSVALYRMIQAVLAHIVRHAHASHVGIELRQTRGDLLLTLLDNGSGWPLQPVDGGSAGSDSTQTLHEQARMLGGHLDLAPVAGGGQRFTLHLPLPLEAVLPDGFARSGAA